MDFTSLLPRNPLHDIKTGVYTPLDAKLLPPLYLAYNTLDGA